MEMLKICSIICGLLVSFPTGTHGSSSDEKAAMDAQSKLFGDLFKVYHNQISPVGIHPNNSDVTLPITVNIDINMQNIVNMDIKSGNLVSRIWLVMNWVDHRLTWNTTGNVKALHVDPSIIWKPDLSLYNGELELEYPEKFPIIQSTGYVHWIVPYKATIRCSKDTQYFPNDKHTCTFKVGSWTHSGTTIDLQNTGGGIMSGAYYVEHTDWLILREKIVRNAVKYPCCPETYIDVTFTVTIQRVTHFYGAILVTPSICIAMAILLVFCLPPACREKMIFLIGIMLALVVLQFHLATVVSEPTALGSFLLFALIADLLVMAETTLVYNFFHRSTRTHPIPDWMRCICMDTLPRVMCLSKPRNRKYDVELKTNQNDCEERDIKIVDGNSTVDDNGEEWRFIARVVDRLSLCIFIVLFAIVSAIILAPSA